MEFLQRKLWWYVSKLSRRTQTTTHPREREGEGEGRGLREEAYSVIMDLVEEVASSDEREGSVNKRKRGAGERVVMMMEMLKKARYHFDIVTFFLPWACSMAFSGVSVAATCLALFPVWIPFEAGFYLYLKEKRKKLLDVDKNAPIPKEDCIRNLHCIVKTLVDLCRSSHPHLSTSFISDWFNGGRAEDITREDALQWMSQSFMFQDYRALETEREKQTVEEVTDVLEKLLRHEDLYGPEFKFKQNKEEEEEEEEGREAKTNTKLEILKPGFNICGHYETTHYPCCVYLGIHIFKQLVSVLVQNLGFEKHSFDVDVDVDALQEEEGKQASKGKPSFTYWLRNASKERIRGKEEEETSPIVLFHGIGTGISSYGVLLKALVCAYPNSSILVVELPLVAMERPWSKDWTATATAGEETLCKPVMQMLKRHGFMPEMESGSESRRNRSEVGLEPSHGGSKKKYPVLMGHSFGCFACRWLLNYEPLASRIAGCVLLDPMVFLLPFPDISKRLQAPCHTFYQLFVRRLIMREPSVAYALNRKSKWPECCLWEEDVRKVKRLNRKIKFDIALSRHDCFFDTELVASYLDQVKSSISADEEEEEAHQSNNEDNNSVGFPAASPWLDHQTYECTHGEMIFRPDLLSHVVKMVHNVIH